VDGGKPAVADTIVIGPPPLSSNDGFNYLILCNVRAFALTELKSPYRKEAYNV